MALLQRPSLTWTDLTDPGFARLPRHGSPRRWTGDGGKQRSGPEGLPAPARRSGGAVDRRWLGNFDGDGAGFDLLVSRHRQARLGVVRCCNGLFNRPTLPVPALASHWFHHTPQTCHQPPHSNGDHPDKATYQAWLYQ